MQDRLGRADARVTSSVGQRHILALVEVLVMMIKADGVIDHAEVLFLMESLAERPPFNLIERVAMLQMVATAQKMTASQDVSARLTQLRSVLSLELRRQVYAMIWDLRQVDGSVDEREQLLLQRVQEAFELTAADVQAALAAAT